MSMEEQALSQTAFILQERGKAQAAAALLDAESLSFGSEEAWNDEYVYAQLNVPGWLLDRFENDDDLRQEIWDVLQPVLSRHGKSVDGLRVGPALPKVDKYWRETLSSRLSDKSVTNHAAKITNPNPNLRRDGFTFESLEEVRVYEALKRTQKALPTNATIAIFPLPFGRPVTGLSKTPDFLVARAGKVGMIEVDGPHHRARLAADMSRDRQWKDSGILEIERILVEDTTDDSKLDNLVRTFLTRLKERS